MEHEIGQMMSARIQAVELAIDHMRNPRQRMPVRRVNMPEGPDNSIHAEAPHYLGISRYVIGIIIVDKPVVERLAENDPGEHCQEDAYRERQPAVGETD